MNTVKERKVVLTGEGADEIFGGYPWFYKEESFARRAFPWSFDMKTRQTLLLDEWIERLPMGGSAREAYEKTIADTPVLEGEKGRKKDAGRLLSEFKMVYGNTFRQNGQNQPIL